MVHPKRLLVSASLTHAEGAICSRTSSAVLNGHADLYENSGCPSPSISRVARYGNPIQQASVNVYLLEWEEKMQIPYANMPLFVLFMGMTHVIGVKV